MATHSSVLSGESQGQGSLVGCCLCGRTESDTTDTTAAAVAGDCLQKGRLIKYIEDDKNQSSHGPFQLENILVIFSADSKI